MHAATGWRERASMPARRAQRLDLGAHSRRKRRPAGPETAKRMVVRRAGYRRHGAQPYAAWRQPSVNDLMLNSSAVAASRFKLGQWGKHDRHRHYRRGPYGLSLAAHLAAAGADFRIFGSAADQLARSHAQGHAC